MREVMSSDFYRAKKPVSLTQTISVTSGKGGVGKTTTVANLAYCLGSMGHRVLILDGDLGMANVDIMFGVRARHSIQDVLSQKMFLEEIMTPVAENVDLIPGGSGIYGLHQLSFLQKQNLLDQVGNLDANYDFMIIDTAPGIDDNVLYLNSAAQEIIVLLTPDPSSLTDAYALIKVLSQKQNESHFSILCNQVKDEEEALKTFRRLADVADRFLCVSLDYKGFIPSDLNLRKATKMQQLVSRGEEASPSGRKYVELAQKYSIPKDLIEMKGSIQFFWEQLSGVA